MTQKGTSFHLRDMPKGLREAFKKACHENGRKMEEVMIELLRFVVETGRFPKRRI